MSGAIKINGTSSGSTTITAPASGGDESIELSTALAAKVTKTAATTAPSSPATGDVWYDTNDSPPTAKFYDGTAWQPFSTGAAAAVISGTPTGTYTDGGIDYAYYTFTASGTLTVTTEGMADLLVVGGGAGGYSYGSGGAGGGAGCVRWQYQLIAAGSHTVTIGAGGAGGSESASNGSATTLGTVLMSGGGGGPGFNRWSGVGGGGSPQAHNRADVNQWHPGGGQGGTLYGVGGYSGITLNYNNSSVEYGSAVNGSGNGAANRGQGGGYANNTGGSGIVIVRVKV